MKASVISLLLAGLVAAQDFTGQPDCAIPCLKDAIPKAGCALTDTACQCKISTQAELAGLAAPCLITKCSTSDLVKAQAAAAAACKKDVGGSSSTSSVASSSASSSATSAAATEPSTGTSAPATTSGADTTAPPSTSAAQTSASETNASETSPPPSTGVASGGTTIPTSGSSGISNSTVSGERSVVTRTSTAFVGGGGGGGGSKTSGVPASTTLAGNDATGPVAGILGAVLAALVAL